ncbi:hypothetical protein [Frankia sp. R43]|uniref:hypothetical protein n=1 Tax=Frankia sp. R43 TaxID=269536 RepID=UPI00128FC0EC|nr:hypothetical protein [Frankia sp. R43]
MKLESPHHDLPGVLRHLPAALEATAQHAPDATTLARTLGYATTSTAGSMQVRSMTLFGLLRIESGSGKGSGGPYRYRATALAQAILRADRDEDRWRHLLLIALTSPPIFRDLYSRFGDSPPEDLATTLAEEHGISADKAAKIVKNYRHGLRLVSTKPRRGSTDLRPSPRSADGRRYTGRITVTLEGGTNIIFPEGAQITRDLTSLIFDVLLPRAQGGRMDTPGPLVQPPAVLEASDHGSTRTERSATAPPASHPQRR